MLAVVAMLDKKILTKSVPKPAVYTFYSTIFLLLVALVIPFGVDMLSGVEWLIAIVAGVSFGLALWAMFIAFKHGEASHMNPFIGGMVTIMSFVFASLFLSEALTDFQLAGMLVLIVASWLLSFEKSCNKRGIHSGFAWGIASGVLFGVSHVASKYLYELYPFITGFVWTRLSIGLVGLGLLLLPSVRSLFKARKLTKAKKEKRKNSVIIVSITKFLGVLAVITIQYAVSIGSVTLVMAMAGIRHAFLFILVMLFTKFAPSIFKEYATKREILVQTFAILLVVIGSAMFVF